MSKERNIDTTTEDYLKMYEEARREVGEIHPSWNHLHAQSAIAMIAYIKYVRMISQRNRG